MNQEAAIGWSEETSRAFVDTGEVYTPRRGEMLATFLDLIPAEPGDAFTGVELAPGAGWLTNGILSRFPHARMIGLDGSPAMLEATRSTLGANVDRADLRLFRLEDPAWPDTLPDGLRCIVSSLAIHHLDHDAKRKLYKRLFDKLETGGALLILDVVEATSEIGAPDVCPCVGCRRAAAIDRIHRIARSLGSIRRGQMESLRLSRPRFRYPLPARRSFPLAAGRGYRNRGQDNRRDSICRAETELILEIA